MIYRYATEYSDYGLETTSFNTFKYPDLSTMSGETKRAWTWVIGTGVINGVSSDGYYYLYPSRSIQRSEFASTINRIQSNSGRWT